MSSHRAHTLGPEKMEISPEILTEVFGYYQLAAQLNIHRGSLEESRDGRVLPCTQSTRASYPQRRCAASM